MYGLKYGIVAAPRKVVPSDCPEKKSGRPPRRGRPPNRVAFTKRGRGQATKVLMRSALRLARVCSGSAASPASLTTRSVSFEVSATKRSNDARAKSDWIWKNSAGDLASASDLTASEACSMPSTARSDASWPIALAPPTAILPA